MKTGVVPGTGKLTGRFCVRVAAGEKGRIKFSGCFKDEAAAKKRLAALKAEKSKA